MLLLRCQVSFSMSDFRFSSHFLSVFWLEGVRVCRESLFQLWNRCHWHCCMGNVCRDSQLSYFEVNYYAASLQAGAADHSVNRAQFWDIHHPYLMLSKAGLVGNMSFENIDAFRVHKTIPTYCLLPHIRASSSYVAALFLLIFLVSDIF